jgi:hypothetical protein
MSSTLASAPVKLNAATSANVIALAYVSDGAESFVFQGPGVLRSIYKMSSHFFHLPESPVRYLKFRLVHKTV